MTMKNHDTKRDKSVKRPRAIGFVRRVLLPTPEKDGYGFIASNVFGLTNIDGRKEVDYYFKFSDWPVDGTLPQEGDVIVFDVVEYDAGKKCARRIERLTFSEKHLEVALMQSEKHQIVSGVLYSSRRHYRANVLELVFQLDAQCNGKTNIIRRVILEHLRNVPREYRDVICMSWFRSSDVAKQIRDAFSDYQSNNNRDAEIIRSMTRLFRVEKTDQVISVQESFLRAMHWIGSKKHELIVRLVRERGELVVKEVRGPDFNEIKKYYIINSPDPEDPWQEGVLPIIGNWVKLGCNSEGYYAFGWKFTNLNRANILEIGVNTEKPVVRVNASDIVMRLYNAVAESPGGAIEEMKNTYDMLGKQLAEAGDDVFIYELLQNANDYPHDDTVDVEIKIEDDGLTFSHTGEAFTARNVAAICTINYRDKSDNPNAIGYKGIGFKTVFRFNNKVIIRSGEFNFSFDEREEKIHDLPWMKTPVLAQSNEIITSEYRVVFKLFPRDSNKLGRGSGSFENILREIFKDERAILFIPKLGKVRIVLPNEQWELNRNGNGWCQSTYEQVVSDEMRDNIDSQLDTDKENCRIPPKYRGMQKTSVSFACKISGRRLVPEANSILYCYLPARKSGWGFKFLMNTDMIPNGARSDIEYSVPLNKDFARIAGDKFFEWIDSLIRSGEYDYDSIFALIPDFDECEKNRSSKVVEFIEEFRRGFEARLPGLRIPSSNSCLVATSEIVFDSTGILKALGESVWERLEYNSGAIPHKLLRDSKDFDLFVKRYKRLLGIQEFDFDKLVEALANESFQEWLTNPMANQQFFKYLDGTGKLELFKSAKIFLDDKGALGTPQEMYFHADIEKYLKDMAFCFRYYPTSTSRVQGVEEKWFKTFDPRTIICDVIFSSANRAKARQLMCQLSVGKLLLTFIAKYKTYKAKSPVQCLDPGTRKYRWYRYGEDVPRFPQEFLQSIPVVLDNDTYIDALESPKYTLFFCDEQMLPPKLDSQWICQEWIGFCAKGYFLGEGGADVRAFLKDWGLVRKWDLRNVLVSIADKFKTQIRERMIDERCDLGFYDFLADCLSGKVVNPEWIKEQISSWPVLDANGGMVQRVGKLVFCYDEKLLQWIRNGWVKEEAIVVLNDKYSAQKQLFDLLGAKGYVEDADNFGKTFRESLAPHLNLDSRESVIAFHKFMSTKIGLLNDDQVGELKNLPVLVRGSKTLNVGIQDVYLPTEIDVEIISGEIKILDDVLCEDDKAHGYWVRLGLKALDEKEILKKRLEEYLERQDKFVLDGVSDTDFKDYHKAFIGALASGNALQMLNDSGCCDAIKKLRLFTKSGRLLVPTEMRLSNEYMPLCEFELFDKCNDVYVAEIYREVEGITEFLKGIGIKSKFSEADVALLSDKEFCKYFWTKYLLQKESDWNEVKDYLKADLPCVLDRTGEVRKPEELYHSCIEDYVLRLPDSDSKLPMIDGIDKDCLSQLEMKTSLSVEDSLAFLLVDSDCKMYKMRGKVLQWIAKWCATASRDLVDKYRNDERAKWRNGQKKLAGIKELCAIRRKNSGQVRLFANDPHVMDLTGLGIGGEGADTMRIEVEVALQWMGVQLVDDGNVEIEPVDELAISDKVISDIAVRMLVFLADRYPDGWEQEFSEMYSRLKCLKFLKCSGFVVQCKDNEWLRAEHGTFLPKGDSFYFVDDWQSKFVFGEMVAELWDKVCKKQYSLDDLKMALDTSGGDRRLAKTIALDKVDLVAGEQFMQKLSELFPNVHGLVCDRLREKERASNQVTEKEKEEPVAVDVAQMTEKEKEESVAVEVVQTHGEETEQERVPPEEPEPEKKYSEEEEEQMFRIFGNDLTVEQMNDENRLVCIRLFNSLKAQGYEPRMLEADFVRDVYSNRKTFRASTIETNDGRQIHVISARKGVAYLPPRWWTRLAKPDNTKYVVCAVLNHLPNGFKYFRCRDDLLTAIGDNLGVIRVHGETAESRLNRTLRLFEFDPELSDFSIYSLLRVKATCNYDAAFREDMKFADSIGREMGADEEQDNDDY